MTPSKRHRRPSRVKTGLQGSSAMSKVSELEEGEVDTLTRASVGIGSVSQGKKAPAEGPT